MDVYDYISGKIDGSLDQSLYRQARDLWMLADEDERLLNVESTIEVTMRRSRDETKINAR